MKQLFKFLDASPTCFHAVENVADELQKNGFIEVKESEDWKLVKGKKYFARRNDSSIVAFAIPGKDIKGFHVFAAHSDSPSFRLKENPEMPFENNYIRLNTEKYGGMIYSSWFDRPLSVAGRVIVRNGEKLECRLVNIDKDLLVIPNAAIHMNSELNKGFEYNPQNDLLPLYSGIEGKESFDKLIAKSIGVKPKEILGKDLFVYTREKAKFVGADKEFIMSPRLDDLACVYAGMEGLLTAKEGSYIQVLAVFDNEEVGSGTKQGADSTLLEDVLWRICEEQGHTRSGYLRMISESFMISADNAHAVHPALAGKADPTNRPYLNKGIVIKFNGNQRYATDAESAAFLRKICEDNDIMTQTYSNRSDVPGGSTLGNISTAHVSMKTADIGLPQLAMHSACETAGSKDTKQMIVLAQKFFEL